MIAGYNSRPVFQYQFRPLANDHRATDGGFCIILYENGILSFSTYDVGGYFIDELCFSLPSRVLQCFFALLRNAGSWLGASPCDLRAANLTAYASSFALPVSFRQQVSPPVPNPVSSPATSTSCSRMSPTSSRKTASG